jgi:hypothetical protein
MKDYELKAMELAEKFDKGEIVEMEWAITELVQSQGEMIADNEDFWLLSAREKAKRDLKNAIALYKGTGVEGEDDRQPVLAGFEHLRQSYTVRGKIVPVEQVSDEDLLERAALLEKQSGALKEHAKEIRKYVAKRSAKRVA